MDGCSELHVRKRMVVRQEEVVPGRVLRVQIQLQDCKLELINVYQFPHNFRVRPDDLRERRRALLHRLSRKLDSIPCRSMLIVGGDFQAEVQPQKGLVGRSTCNTPFHNSEEALDAGELNIFLERHGLVALNTWQGSPAPTQFNPTASQGTGTSQIDFIMVRQCLADAKAKAVKVGPPPIGQWRRVVGHYSLETSIRLMSHHLLPKSSHKAVAFDRKALDASVRREDAKAEALKADLARTLQEQPAFDEQSFNEKALQLCASRLRGRYREARIRPSFISGSLGQLRMTPRCSVTGYSEHGKRLPGIGQQPNRPKRRAKAKAQASPRSTSKQGTSELSNSWPHGSHANESSSRTRMGSCSVQGRPLAPSGS